MNEIGKQNRCLLLLGSNVEREKNMDAAVKWLRDIFDRICFSERIPTLPVGKTEGVPPYLNQLAIGYTSLGKEEIKASLKQFEKEMGRRSEDKEVGRIIIDIDLLKWNEELLKPKEIEREYVQSCLQSFPSDCS